MAPPPSLKVVKFGPGAFAALPVVKIIPSCNGNSDKDLLKYPIPFVEPKLVPVE